MNMIYCKTVLPFVIAIGLLSTGAIAGYADFTPANCALPDDLRPSQAKMSELPSVILANLDSRFGKVADEDDAWRSSDAVYDSLPLPSHKFIGSVERAGDWVVWVAHSGRGSHIHTVGFVSASGALRPMIGPSFVTSPCASTIALFAGVRAVNDDKH